ncbi:DUF4349 domain-containing protein [Flavobacteriaceae bacterium TK19130]|nr:DUF4349 domain-containing protein [Thermobacterium salinum]
MRTLFFFILFIVPFVSKATTAQTIARDTTVVQYDEGSTVEPISFSEEKLKEYRTDEAFDYTEAKREKSWWDKLMDWFANIWNSFWRWLFGDFRGNSFLLFLFEVLPWLIVLGVVIFIVWLFYKLNPGASLLKSKETHEVFFTEEEEIIKTKDIRALIDKALSEGNFRLAVRYYYLLVLKQLTDAEIIDYEFDKTNADYISEIEEAMLNQQFRKATLLYDYIWYGNFSVTQSDFNKAEKTFANLQQNIPGYE